MQISYSAVWKIERKAPALLFVEGLGDNAI